MYLVEDPDHLVCFLCWKPLVFGRPYSSGPRSFGHLVEDGVSGLARCVFGDKGRVIEAAIEPAAGEPCSWFN